MRVGIVALLHESNTFVAESTPLARFEENLLLAGESIRLKLKDSHHEIGGFFSGLEMEGIESVPVFAARALPFGTVTAEAFDSLQEMMFTALAQAGPLEGVLAAPHGATVAESAADADGAWLSQLRETVGSEVPIVATCDPHANLSAKMVEATDALISYRTNPHLDQRERGIEAASLMARTLRGEIRPTQAAAFPPMVMNIERQNTGEEHFAPLHERADAIRRRSGVLSCSLILGFPYADVSEMGSATLVVTDADKSLAQAYANELAENLWERRFHFDARLITVREAVELAGHLEGPVCLLDMGDNVGGGSPGDGTVLARQLMDSRIQPAFVCLYDPEAVVLAEAAGVGARRPFRVGGKSDDLHGSSIEASFAVVSLHDGRFTESEPRHGGMTEFDQGRTAVLRTDDELTVMITSRRMTPFSIRQLTTFGLDPTEFQVLIAKGVNAPVAAYSPYCRHLLRVNTPGVTTADLSRLTYEHRRSPMFPFEKETTWRPESSW